MFLVFSNRERTLPVVLILLELCFFGTVRMVEKLSLDCSSTDVASGEMNFHY